MAQLTWNQQGQNRYETGVDRGVLYLRDAAGAYVEAHAWNGLVTVTESPSGAESNPQYADNIKYLNLKSAEEFGATIEAFTYPDAFERCDGSLSPVPGVAIGQQGRETFGFSYRTKVGDDVGGQDSGEKTHLVYGADAAPSEKAYSTVNDSPEAITFSWEIMTVPVAVGNVEGIDYAPTATIVVDSTKVDATVYQELRDILHGTEVVDGRLPLPAEVVALFA